MLQKRRTKTQGDVCSGNRGLEDLLEDGRRLDDIELRTVQELARRFEKPRLEQLDRRRHAKQQMEKHSRS
ncbi:hypothetical protein HYQ46_006222 [Verticillium longisporum]|nr:hypothetical protein HYQ46_006222 [Verticillium longisporum]